MHGCILHPLISSCSIQIHFLHSIHHMYAALSNLTQSPSVPLAMCLSVCLCVCLSVCLSVCLPNQPNNNDEWRMQSRSLRNRSQQTDAELFYCVLK